MLKLFPSVDSHAGAKGALKAGVFGCLAFEAMLGLGLIVTYFLGISPIDKAAIKPDEALAQFIGVLLEAVIVLIALLRFRANKGLIWGGFVFAIFALECFAKIVGGTANVGWLIVYIAIGASLINGIRGAWAMRYLNPELNDTFS